MERAINLYNFLVENFDEEKYYSKYEICQALSNIYHYDENDTRKCREIEKDVNIINSSGLVNHIIVSSRIGYKIGTREQVKKYLTRMISKSLRSLVRDKKLAKRVGLEGQLGFDLNTGEIEELLVFLKRSE